MRRIGPELLHLDQRSKGWGSDEGRRQKIAEVCSTAPAEVSLQRRIDVALWMYATRG